MSADVYEKNTKVVNNIYVNWRLTIRFDPIALSISISKEFCSTCRKFGRHSPKSSPYHPKNVSIRHFG